MLKKSDVYYNLQRKIDNLNVKIKACEREINDLRKERDLYNLSIVKMLDDDMVICEVCEGNSIVREYNGVDYDTVNCEECNGIGLVSYIV